MQTSQAVRTDQRTDSEQSRATALCELTRTHKRDFSVRPKGAFKPERRDSQGNHRSPRQQPSGAGSTAQGRCSSDVEFKIDSGADTSVISQHTYDTLKTKPKLEHSQAVLDCPGGRLKNKGKFKTSTYRKRTKYCFDVHVVEGSAVNNLLGREVSVAMGLIRRVENVTSAPSESVGLLRTTPVKIKLKDGAVPYSVTTARWVSLPLLSKVKEELNRMVKCGVIEEVTEPTAWCAPMVPVPRKYGRVRICVGLGARKVYFTYPG